MIRIPSVSTTQMLATLQMEIERGIRTQAETQRAYDSIHNLIKHFTAITTERDTEEGGNDSKGTDTLLNVPPDESEMFRLCTRDLCVLAGVIDQLLREDEIKRQSLPDASNPVEDTATTSTLASPSEETSTENRGPLHSLAKQIEHNIEILEKLLKFVDKKTERRWWLRDVIHFAQFVVKVLLFISASIA
ncbi:hypothetical protein PMAYCL1PPCAC_26845, partial [Pristionchus mayeri]